MAWHGLTSTFRRPLLFLIALEILVISGILPVQVVQVRTSTLMASELVQEMYLDGFWPPHRPLNWIFTRRALARRKWRADTQSHSNQTCQRDYSACLVSPTPLIVSASASQRCEVSSLCLPLQKQLDKPKNLHVWIRKRRVQSHISDPLT